MVRDNQIGQPFLLYHDLWLIVDYDSFGAIQIRSKVVDYDLLLIVQVLYQGLGLNLISLQQFLSLFRVGCYFVGVYVLKHPFCVRQH